MTDVPVDPGGGEEAEEEQVAPLAHEESPERNYALQQAHLAQQEELAAEADQPTVEHPLAGTPSSASGAEDFVERAIESVLDQVPDVGDEPPEGSAKLQPWAETAAPPSKNKRPLSELLEQYAARVAAAPDAVAGRPRGQHPIAAFFARFTPLGSGRQGAAGRPASGEGAAGGRSRRRRGRRGAEGRTGAPQPAAGATPSRQPRPPRPPRLRAEQGGQNRPAEGSPSGQNRPADGTAPGQRRSRRRGRRRGHGGSGGGGGAPG